MATQREAADAGTHCMAARTALLSAVLALAGCSGYGPDLALSGDVTTSSTHLGAVGESGARALVDGDASTRWSSTYADHQWVMIDLKRERTVSQLRLSWETAAARDYRVLLSSDGRNWRETAVRQGMTIGPRFDLIGLVGTARYIKLDLQRRATRWGFSLYEVMVFGERP
jgi:hypothetical protein